MTDRCRGRRHTPHLFLMLFFVVRDAQQGRLVLLVMLNVQKIRHLEIQGSCTPIQSANRSSCPRPSCPSSIWIRTQRSLDRDCLLENLLVGSQILFRLGLPDEQLHARRYRNGCSAQFGRSLRRRGEVSGCGKRLPGGHEEFGKRRCRRSHNGLSQYLSSTGSEHGSHWFSPTA